MGTHSLTLVHFHPQNPNDPPIVSLVPFGPICHWPLWRRRWWMASAFSSSRQTSKIFRILVRRGFELVRRQRLLGCPSKGASTSLLAFFGHFALFQKKATELGVTPPPFSTPSPMPLVKLIKPLGPEPMLNTTSVVNGHGQLELPPSLSNIPKDKVGGRSTYTNSRENSEI